MTNKTDQTCVAKLESIGNELSRTMDRLAEFKKLSDENLSSIESDLRKIQSNITDRSSYTEVKAQILSVMNSVRSKLTDCTKAHREVHPPISKFGKLVDKSFVDDLSHLTTYFNNSNKKDARASSRPTVKPVFKESALYSDCSVSRSREDLLRLVIIEHLLREGYESLASDLMENFGFTENDIKLGKFSELSSLITAIHQGDLEPAKKWLSDNKSHLGPKTRHLEYTLAKLDFLSTVQREDVDPTAVIQSARQLAPFTEDYSSDFEHLMGSLVFFGRSLEGTPYADLALPVTCPPQTSLVSRSQSLMSIDNPDKLEDDIAMEDSDPPKSSSGLSGGQKFPQSNNALTEAAALFKISCCHQLNLSEIDPLFMVFSSGCRVLTRLHSLQRAIACLSKYSSLDGDTLPIAVKLDPSAHRHNIFHCPVIKEVTADSNGPVRLICGHAISRDAFNSLVGGERSRMKCPYCPVETYKNQVLPLIF